MKTKTPAMRLTATLLSFALIQVSFGPEAWAGVARVGASLGNAPVGGVPLSAVNAAGLAAIGPLPAPSRATGLAASAVSPLASSAIGAQNPAAQSRPAAAPSAAAARAVGAPASPALVAAGPATAGVASRMEPAAEAGARFFAERRDGGPMPSESAAPVGPNSAKPASGRKLLILGARAHREFLMESPREWAERNGFELFVADTGDNRNVSRGIVDDDHFITVDALYDHAPEVMRRTADGLAAAAEEKGFTRKDVVRTYLDGIANLNSMVVDRLGVFGNSHKTVEMAQDKAALPDLAQSLDVPHQFLPASARVNMAQPRTLGDYWAVWRNIYQEFPRVSGSGKSGQVVIKPVRGAGSTLIFTENIDTWWKAVWYWHRVNHGLSDPHFAAKKTHSIDYYPGIMMQYRIPDGPEVDVEVTGRAGRYDMVVSDNPPTHDGSTEKGSTFPSQLPADMTSEATRTAAQALDLIGWTAGNAHVELKYSLRDRRWYLIEINPRMGGAVVHTAVKAASGADLIHADLDDHFGLPSSQPKIAAMSRSSEFRLVIAKVSGTIKSVSGVEAARAMPGIVSIEVLKAIGDAFQNRQNTMDYFAMVTAAGDDYDQAYGFVRAALRAISFTVIADRDQTYTDDDGRRVKVRKGEEVAQTAEYAHWAIDQSDILNGGDGRAKAAPSQQPASSGIWGSLREKFAAIAALPKSIFLFTVGWTVNAAGQEIQAVALPLYSAALFNLPTALIVTGVSMFSRIPGVWMGSFFMSRFNPIKINNLAMLSIAALGASIGVAALMGASKPAMFAILVVNALVNGLAYGINRGVAEQLIPRLILGQKGKDQFGLAFNFAYQWVELSCIVAALFVAEFLLQRLGGSLMMLVSSGAMALAPGFYSVIKFAEPWKKEDKAASPAPVADGARQAPAIGLREYLPYGYFRFGHFLVYGVLATILALSVFTASGVAGTTIGLYDGGSWLISLLASMALLPKGMGKRAWTAAGAATMAAFLWSAVLVHSPLLTFALGGLLGAMITKNSVNWMSYYNGNLPADKFRNLNKWLMTWSTLALLPIFAALSAIRISPAVAAVLSMPMLLTGISAAVTAASALMLSLLYKDELLGFARAALGRIRGAAKK